MITRSNWFEHFFEGIALDMWRQCLTPEQTRAEVDFLERVLGKKKRLLDVPCGNGRHSLALARRGHRVTGVDLSKGFIAEAKQAAATEKARVEFVLADMRRLPWRNQFDAAFCMGNSFGYMVYPDMEKFVRGLARALRPSARFVIETGCIAEAVLPGLKERGWYEVGDILFAIHNRYLVQESCLETECTFVRNGRSERRKFWHWIYSVAELRRLLEKAGLQVTELYGSLDCQPFKWGDSRLLLVGRKPASR